MSWFKRTSSIREDGQVAVNGRGSPGRGGGGESHDPTDTDPDTCFEVFKNHWLQATNVIGAGNKKGSCSNDDVETVVHNVEHMMTLLVGEEGIDGMPGPIVYFLLEKEVLETYCNWCNNQRDYQDKLCMDQLRMYELLISQSRQLLLIHRQVIRPLLRLLKACAESQAPSSESEELEFRLVLVLHQICTCISQQTLILESFFTTEADHGPAKFLIFSLLIPYIHREGPIGQRARDALLLLMTLSAVHPHIGHYIAENSDFCPVLATGLSGLYSSLPRKITPPTEDWYALSEEDCQRIADLQMFLNSLEFCNAVVQVAHHLVRDQLIKYIYTGFLLPVLGPALHQNSRDEVMTATAYLDLFLRRISEPHLIRAFLRFVLTERHDEMLILESLITRINSNTKLSLVSLSLFHTLVDMNCEEVMYQLVFKYLIPCTHVMVSQRRAVRDLDLYGKSAEKFLSLRPVCCMTYPAPSPSPQGQGPAPSGTPSPVLSGHSQTPSRTTAGRSASVSTPAELAKVPIRQEPRRRSLFRSKKEKKKLDALPEDEQKQVGESPASTEGTSFSSDDASQLSESCYADYLLQARTVLEQCARACRNWSAPYDGERPPPDSILDHPTPASGSNKATDVAKDTDTKGSSGTESTSDNRSECVEQKPRTHSAVKLLSHGNVSGSGNVPLPDGEVLEQQMSSVGSEQKSCSASHSSGSDTAALSQNSASSSVISDLQCNKNPSSSAALKSTSASTPDPSHAFKNVDLAKLHMCLDDLDSFLAFLNEMNLSPDVISQSLEDSLSSFDSLINALNMRKETPHETIARKSIDRTRIPSTDREGSRAEKEGDSQVAALANKSTANSATSTTNTTVSSQVRKTPAPPKTLGLVPAKDVSLGGKCRTLSPLWGSTPDDISRAFIMSPTSPGFLLSPSSSSSAALRPLPAAVRYSNSPPNIGPFLAAVFSRLEGMVQNSLYANLLLTGLVSRLAAFPHPLLRSFLLNVNLVFQPSVKSLVQVLSSVRQKVDSYAVTTGNFSSLIQKARLNLKRREDTLLYPSQAPPTADYLSGKPRAATLSEIPSEKKKVSLADLLFRRSPKPFSQPGSGRGRGKQLQWMEVSGGGGYRFINSLGQSAPETPDVKTWNAVYCALVLEEFLKELAALSLEHSVLSYDEGYVSS